MFCEVCHQKEAMVHLSGSRTAAGESTPPVKFERHFCEDCHDEYCKTQGMNSSRDLIQLSERYRSKLYDLLEAQHPEVVRAGDDKLGEAAEAMEKFLRAQLKQEGIEVNEDGFAMLFGPFIGSAEFYDRCDRHKRGDRN
jgi:hypothetical protein